MRPQDTSRTSKSALDVGWFWHFDFETSLGPQLWATVACNFWFTDGSAPAAVASLLFGAYFSTLRSSKQWKNTESRCFSTFAFWSSFFCTSLLWLSSPSFGNVRMFWALVSLQFCDGLKELKQCLCQFLVAGCFLQGGYVAICVHCSAVAPLVCARASGL